MHRTTVTALLLASTLLASGGCSYSTTNNRTHIEAPYRVQHAFVIESAGPIDVDVETQRGRVDVAPHGTPLPAWIDATVVPAVATDRQVLVIAVAQSESFGRPERVRLEPRLGAGRLELAAEWPALLPSERGNPTVEPDDGVEYVVRAPALRSLNARTDWGSVTGASLAGDATVRTDTGDVSLRDHGGSSSVQTDVGDVHLIRHAGTTSVKTDVGDVHLQEHAAAATVRTDVGDVTVALLRDNPGPVNLTTDVGDVRLTAGPALDGTLELRTDVGDIDLDGRITGATRMRTSGSSWRIVRSEVSSVSQVTTDVGDIRVLFQE